MRGSRGPPISMDTYGHRRGILSRENETIMAPYPNFFILPLFSLVSFPLMLIATPSHQLKILGCMHSSEIFILTLVTMWSATLPHSQAIVNEMVLNGSLSMVLISIIPLLNLDLGIHCLPR